MQYGTKGEGRDGATGGLPNGGEGGQAAEAAAETTSAERDSRTLDYLITVIGFGLCRAWIVFCLGAPLIAGAASSFTWAYLLFGALSALTVSFVANRSGKREGVVRVALFRATPVALAASGIIIPVALALNSEALMIVGFVAGGLGAGPLQVLWGDRFARHATLFAAVASPAAAIVTALVAGMSNDHDCASFIGLRAVMPCYRSAAAAVGSEPHPACRGATSRRSPKRNSRSRTRMPTTPRPARRLRGTPRKNRVRSSAWASSCSIHDVFVPVLACSMPYRPPRRPVSRSSAEAQYSDSS